MSPRDVYLETQVATASPQRLRLMLIEGAIRQARLTVELWREQRSDEALESLIRCRAIVSELLAGVRDEDSMLAKRVVGLYAFLFQSLTAAQLSRDPAVLASVLRVLEEERQTWSQVCFQLAEAADGGDRLAREAEPASAGLSLEA